MLYQSFDVCHMIVNLLRVMFHASLTLKMKLWHPYRRRPGYTAIGIKGVSHP